MKATTQTDIIRELQRQIDFLTVRLFEAEAHAPQTAPQLDNRTLLADGHSCHLSKLEAKLMALLLDHPGETIHFAQVKKWNDGPYSLRVLVCRLKKKMLESGMFALMDMIVAHDNGYSFVTEICNVTNAHKRVGLPI